MSFCLKELAVKRKNSALAGPKPQGNRRRVGGWGEVSIKLSHLALMVFPSSKSVDITTRAQAGVGVLVEPSLSDRIIDWKPVSGRVVILRLKLQQTKSMTLVQVYAPNLEGEYETFLEQVQWALYEMPNTPSLIIVGNFNAHIGVDAEKQNDVN
ncbi:unnamed protein product [Soboliphyme baturini]|uniref:Craniofacial development protein 2-like n=1 Tax=Soboliphyme baturini TaxID=241478 RepID=A0A183ICN3_9BILA|nr:unnamed protein product [Soboliphyme baturini]